MKLLSLSCFDDSNMGGSAGVEKFVRCVLAFRRRMLVFFDERVVTFGEWARLKRFFRQDHLLGAAAGDALSLSNCARVRKRSTAA
jgi:hypothetical protein